jgi:hypothetical protein
LDAVAQASQVEPLVEGIEHNGAPRSSGLRAHAGLANVSVAAAVRGDLAGPSERTTATGGCGCRRYRALGDTGRITLPRGSTRHTGNGDVNAHIWRSDLVLRREARSTTTIMDLSASRTRPSSCTTDASTANSCEIPVCHAVKRPTIRRGLLTRDRTCCAIWKTGR